MSVENTLLIGLSRQIALQRKMEVVANNMANQRTSGFKAEEMLFEQYLMPVAQMTENVGTDKRLSYVHDRATYGDFREGAREQTGNELDIAISGDGWLAVQTPAGERYTRNGELKLSPTGQIVTHDGLAVLGIDGPITVGATDSNLTIAGDGSVSSSAGPLGKLKLVRFADNDALKREGSNLYRAEDLQPQESADVRVVQGMIERSNVEPVRQVTELIDTMRAYASIANMLKQADDLRKQAIERLGQTNSF